MQFPHLFIKPKIHPSVFRFPQSVVVGDVELAEEVSLWPSTVLRGDVNFIRIGARANLQDLTVVHVSSKGLPTVVGEDVTVGHQCTLHACKIGSRVLIGMGTTIMDGVEIGDDTLVGAGSLITANQKFPSGVKILGRPAKVVGQLSDLEMKSILDSSKRYVALAKTYRETSNLFS